MGYKDFNHQNLTDCLALGYETATTKIMSKIGLQE